MKEILTPTSAQELRRGNRKGRGNLTTLRPSAQEDFSNAHNIADSRRASSQWCGIQDNCLLPVVLYQESPARNIMTVSLPQTNRAPVFNFKAVICNSSNLCTTGTKEESRARGRFELLKSPTGHSRQAPLLSVSQSTSPHPTQATKVSLSGWFINCQTWIQYSHPAQKEMQNRSFTRICCPSSARPKYCRKRLF